MAHLIDKDALIAEIDRQKIGYNVDGKHSVEYDIVRKIIDIINTLETKDVDLEKEYEEYVIDDPIFGRFITNDTMGMKLAKHFFELGLKTNKGE
jgi:hypothetical protein